MLTEALIAIAASGGTAVVQAAGSDAWTSLRHRLATLMGRGDEQRTGTELERLDRTATAIVNASPEQAERVRTLQEGTWQTRLEDWLESASSAEREHAAEELRGIIAAVMEKKESGSTFHGDVRQDAKASGNARVYQLGQGEMRISD
ncbi:hypothetical protein [Streptomyces sp. DSM 41013]